MIYGEMIRFRRFSQKKEVIIVRLVSWIGETNGSNKMGLAG